MQFLGAVLAPHVQAPKFKPPNCPKVLFFLFVIREYTVSGPLEATNLK